MRRRLLVSALLSIACADDDEAEPGSELGPCVQAQYCEQPLVCTDGICVHPDQIAEDDGASEASFTGGGDGGMRYDLGGGTMPGEDSSPGDSGPVDDGGTGGAEIYCTPSTDGGCFCGHTADYGPLGQPCSTSTVGSPSQCCANEGWPGYAGCSCWAQSCRRISSDTCLCGIGTVEPEDEAVSSCTPDGGICCHDGSSCACWNSITQCLEGEMPVESCSVESLACDTGSSEVAACN